MRYIVLIAFLMLGGFTQTLLEKVHVLKSEITELTVSLNKVENFYLPPQKYQFGLPIVPEDYIQISSYMGYRNDPLRANSGSIRMKNHPALDLTGVYGARVRAIGDGIVESKWYPEGWHHGVYYKGNPYFNGYVQIRLSNGWLASYGHVFDIIVHEGEYVKAGQPFARINPVADKMSTGPHVHFSLQDADGKFLQPQQYIDFKHIQ